jgi:hypothetical protein
MTTNLRIDSSRKVLTAAILNEALLFCEKRSDIKISNRMDTSSPFDSLTLYIETYTPDLILSDGVAKIRAKFSQ